MMLRTLLVLSLVFVASACKPRRSNSGLASGEPCGQVAEPGCELPPAAKDFMNKLGKIEFINETSRQFGLYKNDHRAIADLYQMATRDSNRRIQLRSAAVLAEVMERGNMSTISVAGNRYRARDVLNALYIRGGNSKFKLCENAIDCSWFLQDLASFYKLPATDLDYNRVFNDVRADLKLMAPTTSVKIMEFRVSAAQIWQRFYSVTGYESLLEQGKTPSGTAADVQALHADAKTLMGLARSTFRVHNDPTRIKKTVVRDLLLGEMLASVMSSRPDLIAKAGTVDNASLGIDPVRQLTKEEEALITEGLDSIVASTMTAVDSLEVLTIYLERVNVWQPEQFNAWLQSVRQRVTAWYQSYRPNTEVKYPDDVISPAIAVRMLSVFMPQEMLLPGRDQWLKLFEDMARSVPTEMKDATNLNRVVTEGRNLLNAVNQTISERLTELGFDGKRMIAKEKYLAKQEAFNSWWYQTDRFIKASMLVGSAAGELERVNKDGSSSKEKIKEAENALKTASDSMASFWLTFACYDYRFGAQGAASATLPEGFGPNTTTSPKWCAGWFSGFRKAVGVDHVLGDGFDAPGPDGKLNLEKLCRYPDESRPNSFALEGRVNTYVMKLRVKEICDATAMESTVTTMSLLLNPTGIISGMVVSRILTAGATMALKVSVNMGGAAIVKAFIRSTASKYLMNVLLGSVTFTWLNKTWYALAGLQPWWDNKRSWSSNLFFGQEYLWGAGIFAGMPLLQRISGSLATKMNKGLYGGAATNLAQQGLIRAPLGMRAIDFALPVVMETAVFVPMPYVEHWVNTHLMGNSDDATVQQMKLDIGEIRTETLKSLMMVLSFRLGHGAHAVETKTPTIKDYNNNPLRSLRKITEERFGDSEVVDARMVLGVSRHANMATVDAAYKRTLDAMAAEIKRTPSKAQELKPHLDLIETSYQTLKDPAARAKHDAALDKELASTGYSTIE